MELTIKLAQNERELMQGILEQYAENINNTLKLSYNTVYQRIASQIRQRIQESSEVQSLISGDLRQELGIVDGQQAVTDITKAVTDNIELTIESARVTNGQIVSGGYLIKIIQSNYQALFALPSVAYFSKNVLIPWLSWLLSAGTSPVIFGYRIDYNPENSQNSRTGGPIMVKSQGSWSVPQEYAGTIDDNFLTRALSGIEQEIQYILSQEVGR